MLAQLKRESGATDAIAVAKALLGADFISLADCCWAWPVLVASVKVATPTSSLQASASMLAPLLASPHQFHIEYMHGLGHVSDVLLQWTTNMDVAARMLHVLVHQLVPDYFTSAMTGLENDWKFLYGVVHHFDPRLGPHLATIHVALPDLLASWSYRLFVDALHPTIVRHVYTWVLAEAVTSRARSKWLVSLSAALLLYLGDALLSVADAPSFHVVLRHFCTVTLGDEAIAKAFLDVAVNLHGYIKAPFPPLRLQSPPDEPSSGRLFVRPTAAATLRLAPTLHPWPPARDGASCARYLHHRPRAFSDIEASIEKDIPRTFVVPPEAGPALTRVLTSFAIRCPRIGYCQGMNEIAGVLLASAKMDEEKAFWALVYLLEDVLPEYHTHSMAGLHADCSLLQSWLVRNDPYLSQHLAALGLNMEVLCTTWLVTCFVTSAPAPFYERLLAAVFAAPSPQSASRIPLVTALAILLHLSPQLTLEREAGVVLRRLKLFLHSLSTPETASSFLETCSLLWAQLPPPELASARDVHLSSVHAVFDARESKKAALREQKLTPSKAMVTSSRRRFGLVPIPSPPKSPIRKLGESVRKGFRIPRSIDDDDDDDDGDSDASDVSISVRQHLATTAQLYESEAIDADELDAIQRRILTSWLDALQTPAHVADRVTQLKNAIDPAPVDEFEIDVVETPKKKGYGWRRAKAKVTALGARLRPRAVPKPAPRAMSLTLSPTALTRDAIGHAIYDDDQRVTRKLELMSQSLFDEAAH
ncbi:hypothetical protein SPRG_11002 [Saprolegnia parasitica CBS 223.65]|uniref:Rab-GAP TBC domain-containing protein n=1 Tax=Saprolegnia parasitica (strain CBS 223.65) TaxID=695850 RepID=A0A067C7E1_SAPPC|nr:hypothetical protein SPRG_11002 [Saprolegnia parasitica CBS 223.65]KDO22687.1 hypothetical protein SPRG_11002 [Saprolegnia parasitica CBS 223.65]|eukprot:XP_012206602.1 hypothetical protein SPRG_11002 [Saprolegnia parasitica CBS 223.65]